MKKTRYITTTIQADNRLEIDLPNIPIPPFLKLSIEERRQILAQQAEAALPYYEDNKAEWEEWINLDIAETYAP
jgi:hypothetical protein